MKIFIMRHGEAHHYAASDAERALTERGRNESVAVARVCIQQQHMGNLDKVLVSPYLRAQQTWQEMSRFFAARQIEICDDITPYGQARDVFEYIAALVEVDPIDSLLLVSHLPLVGYLASEFVADMVPPMFPTSGMMCIEYDPPTRQGKVAWNVHP